MKKGISVLILSYLIMVTYSQQDPQFSQYMFNIASFNPGYAGSNEMICLSAINRQQWIGFEGAPSSSFFNANASVKPFGINSGVGLSIASDNVAFNKDLGIYATYAYRLDLGPGILGIGINLGIYNKALEADWYIPDDLGPAYTINDDAIPQKDESQMSFDLGFGLYYKTDNLYFGLSTTHLNQAKIKYNEKLPSYLSRHYYAIVGYTFQLSNPLFEILPSVLLKTDGRTNQIDVNTLVQYNKKFWGGVSYRAGDALIGLIGFELFNGLKIGYSYDFTTSDIGNYSDGSHEFTLRYCFSLSLDKKPQKYKSIRFL